MLELSEKELAYIAGIVDGEGCITVRSPAKGDASYPVSMTFFIANTDISLLNWLLDRICGGVSWNETPVQTKPYWRLVFPVAFGEELLRALLPYLIVKKPQAELMLKIRDAYHANPVRRRKDGVFPPEVHAFRKECYEAMRELNKGPKPIGQHTPQANAMG